MHLCQTDDAKLNCLNLWHETFKISLLSSSRGVHSTQQHIRWRRRQYPHTLSQSCQRKREREGEMQMQTLDCCWNHKLFYAPKMKEQIDSWAFHLLSLTFCSGNNVLVSPLPCLHRKTIYNSLLFHRFHLEFPLEESLYIHCCIWNQDGAVRIL